MQIEVAKSSHIGDRNENQDRVEILIGDHTALAIVVDGMGGHAAGAAAAITTVATMAARFRLSKQPLPYPERFLTRAIGEAHDAVVRMGRDKPLDDRPRATCAVGLVQQDTACWAHVGDSRVYLVRDDHIVERTRDHTHVEMLLQEGLLDESDIAGHPMRSFVDQCLGGDAARPPVTVSGPHPLSPGDTVLVCSDGIWNGGRDGLIASALQTGQSLQHRLDAMVRDAVARNQPASDNATVAAIRWVSDDPERA